MKKYSRLEKFGILMLAALGIMVPIGGILVLLEQSSLSTQVLKIIGAALTSIALALIFLISSNFDEFVAKTKAFSLPSISNWVPAQRVALFLSGFFMFAGTVFSEYGRSMIANGEFLEFVKFAFWFENPSSGYADFWTSVFLKTSLISLCFAVFYIRILKMLLIVKTWILHGKS